MPPRMLASRGVFALALALVLTACPAGPELAVDVRTDLVPGLEFDAVRVELEERVAPLVDARIGDDFARARRVAEFGRTGTGRHTLAVSLLRAGAPVVSRRVVVRLDGSLIVLVLLTRDCRGVTCPGSGDSPNETECLGGRCIDPECLDATDECIPRECTADGDCASATACVVPTCLGGVCVELPREGACAANEVCLPGTGCVALPGASDAGSGGGDAGTGGSEGGVPSDAGVECTPETCVAGPCETASCVAGVCERASLCADGEECCRGVCAADCATALCAGREAGFVCRPAAGPCDVEETCDGTSVECPPDDFAPTGTACSEGSCNGLGECTSGCIPGAPCSTGNPCEVGSIECTSGSPRCVATGPAPASTVCRPAAGPCDVAETCGGATTCPDDAFLPSGSVCRASAGDCDVAETCSGTSAACPDNAFRSAGTVCRASAGECDVAETCSGTSATCPSNGFRSAGTVCRASAGECDVAEACSGTSATCPDDGFAPSSQVCRPAVDACDATERCTGTGPTCPPDEPAPAGSACGPGAWCSGGLCCRYTCAGISSCPPMCGFCGDEPNCLCSCCGGTLVTECW